MSFCSSITKQRNKYSTDLVNNEKYWSLSALSLSYFRTLKDIATYYVKGRTLDAGAGWLNGKLLLAKYGDEYVRLDIENKSGNIDIIGDVQDMNTIELESFDTVYSSQVLEHVPRPWDALAEIYRVLKKGGYAIISVPHLSGLHDEPSDFYRYTPYGIRFLLEKAGFIIEREYRSGSLFCFLSHHLSLFIISLFWLFPVIRWLIWWANKIFIVQPAIWIDKIFKLDCIFPTNIVIISRKPI
jgi:SAM-dependent methyltransferase